MSRIYYNYYYLTDLFAIDLHSSLAYFMMTHHLPVVARQLPTHAQSYIQEQHTHIYTVIRKKILSCAK